MIIRATGIFHFAQGEIMMLGALFGLSAESLLPLPFPALVVVGMIGGGFSAIVSNCWPIVPCGWAAVIASLPA